MSDTTIDHELARYSKDIGIPRRELKRLCVLAGLEQLKKGNLKVVRKTNNITKVVIPDEQ